MISNTPWNRSRKAKALLYTEYPEDLRPGWRAAAAAHLGTAIEFALPITLFLSSGGVIGTIAVIGMIIFHVHITSTFPLAVPLLAGPSAMATVLLLASRQPDRLWQWVGALTVAMAVSAVVLLAADRIRQWIGDSMVSAIEKLMGLVLTAIAVEMVLAGLKRYFFES